MSFAATAEASIPLVAAPPSSRSAHRPLKQALRRSSESGRQLESIVVPLDGGDFAEHAIPTAIAIARRAGSVIRLVHAFTPAARGILYPGGDAFDLVEGQLRTRASRYLKQLQRRIAADAHDLTVVTHLVEAATVVEALTRVGKSADLVVMATHGRGWLGRFFLGSVARDMLRESTTPVLCVRGYDCPPDFSADPVPRHLTIALDGRTSSERSLEVAAAIAETTGAGSTLLHVVDPHEANQQFAHVSPEFYLERTRRQLLDSLPDVSTRVVRNAVNPASGILSHIDESESDLIVVTSRWGPSAFGSTAENLLRRSTVPVLVLREDRPEAS